MKINPTWGLVVAVSAVIAAVILNRPVKVSILENVFIEVGDGEAGPPVFYEKALELDDGRTIYLSNGACRVKAADEGEQ